MQSLPKTAKEILNESFDTKDAARHDIPNENENVKGNFNQNWHYSLILLYMELQVTALLHCFFLDEYIPAHRYNSIVGDLRPKYERLIIANSSAGISIKPYSVNVKNWF